MYFFGPNAAQQMLSTCQTLTTTLTEQYRLNQLFAVRILSILDINLKTLITDISEVAQKYSDPDKPANPEKDVQFFEDILGEIDLQYDVGIRVTDTAFQADQDRYNLTVALFKRGGQTFQVVLTVYNLVLERLAHAEYLVALHKHQLFLISLYNVIKDTQRRFMITGTAFPVPDQIGLEEARYKNLVTMYEVLIKDNTIARCQHAFPSEDKS